MSAIYATPRRDQIYASCPSFRVPVEASLLINRVSSSSRFLFNYLFKLLCQNSITYPCTGLFSQKYDSIKINIQMAEDDIVATWREHDRNTLAALQLQVMEDVFSEEQRRAKEGKGAPGSRWISLLSDIVKAAWRVSWLSETKKERKKGEGKRNEKIGL